LTGHTHTKTLTGNWSDSLQKPEATNSIFNVNVPNFKTFFYFFSKQDNACQFVIGRTTRRNA
jgi:hypothetical protein